MIQWQENSPIAPMSLSEIKDYLKINSNYRLPTRNELFTAFEAKIPGFFTYGFYWTTFSEMKMFYKKKTVESEKFLVRLVKI